jgi:hypothetical protein
VGDAKQGVVFVSLEVPRGGKTTMGRSSIPPFPPALEARRSLQKMSGIEHLMIAVVSTAFDDLRGHDTRQRDTAVKYFFSDPETHVLSFPSVCRQMDWSVSAVRRRLMQSIGSRPLAMMAAATAGPSQRRL